MEHYIAFLRGVNVGGNGKVSMPALKAALTTHDNFQNVTTYINSGNVLFSSASTDRPLLIKELEDCIASEFGLDVPVALFNLAQWEKAITMAPRWWGKDPSWKHNLLMPLPGTTADGVVAAIGTLKPGIENVESGEGVVYQSMSFQQFGKTTSGKLASNPIYKQMTIRNENTSRKLLALLRQYSDAS